MATFHEQALIALPVEDVLPIILTPSSLAACIPFEAPAELGENDRWRGTIKIPYSLGVAVFQCDFGIEQESANSATIQLHAAYEGGATSFAAAANIQATTMTGVVRDDGGVPGGEIVERKASATTLSAIGQLVMTGAIEGLNDGSDHAKAFFEQFVDNIAAMGAQDESQSELDDALENRLSPREEARAAAADFIPDGPMNTRRPSMARGEATPVNVFIRLIVDFFKNLFRRGG